LQEWGFAINPYDPCVANKMISGEQCTVLWHVDDLKVSHVDKKAVEAVLKLLNSEFGKETWEGPRLSRNADRLHDTRKGANHDDRLH
jgi:hypothetical protein